MPILMGVSPCAKLRTGGEKMALAPRAAPACTTRRRVILPFIIVLPMLLMRGKDSALPLCVVRTAKTGTRRRRRPVVCSAHDMRQMEMLHRWLYQSLVQNVDLD